MIAIIDTNFLVKYFTADKYLGKKAQKVFEDESVFIIIPSIVLVELKYAAAKKRIDKEIIDSTKVLVAQENCMVYPLDENLVDSIPVDLNIHDGIIFATAIIQTKSFTEDIFLLTKDREIEAYRQDEIKIIW